MPCRPSTFRFCQFTRPAKNGVTQLAQQYLKGKDMPTYLKRPTIYLSHALVVQTFCDRTPDLKHEPNRARVRRTGLHESHTKPSGCPVRQPTHKRSPRTPSPTK